MLARMRAAVVSDQQREVLINTDYVVSVRDEGRHRTVFMTRGEEYVLETLDDIQKLCGEGAGPPEASRAPG
jgi:DNA-binding LytR/AlgR family response regulator